MSKAKQHLQVLFYRTQTIARYSTQTLRKALSRNAAYVVAHDVAGELQSTFRRLDCEVVGNPLVPGSHRQHNVLRGRSLVLDVV